MNTKNLIAAAIVSACASIAFAAAPAQADLANTFTPSDVTAQVLPTSVGSDVQSKNAGNSEQANQTVNFANSMEPSVVTAQSGK